MNRLIKTIKQTLITLRGLLIVSYLMLLAIILSTIFFCLLPFTCLIPIKRWRVKVRSYSYLLYRFLSVCTEPALQWHTPIHVYNHNAPERFDYNKSYIMISNHQSWVDVLILGGLIHNRTSLIKVLMKKELLWQLPFASWFCYFNGFPFLDRSKKGHKRDIQSIIDACQSIKKSPSTLMSFIEGTRFSEKKHQRSKSRYQYLLPPKYFGLAASIQALQEVAEGIIDVTVIYNPRYFGMLDFIRGNIQQVEVHYNFIPITPQLCGDYQNDREFKQYFRSWLDQIWKQKDMLIGNCTKTKNLKSSTPKKTD